MTKRFLGALAQGKKYLPAIFVAVIAADEINLGTISHNQIAEDLSSATTVELVCVHCNKIYHREDMVMALDGLWYDRVCVKNFGDLPATFSAYGIDKRLQVPLQVMQRRRDAGMDLPAVLQYLLDEHVPDASDLAYNDGYDGYVVDLSAPALSAPSHYI
ncbi:hypothetical protein LTR17_023618 [Elasticomyces elasticus]|nr:hypothetical protein LTR17_023618 [Elasticomyces elasticus]